MQARHSIATVLVLALASCATPPEAVQPPAPTMPGPKAQVSVGQPQPDAAPPQAVVDNLALNAAGPVGLINATAVGSQGNSAAGNAIDGNAATRWQSAVMQPTSSLTVELNNPTPLKPLTVTLNTSAFPAGTSFSILASTAAGGPFTTLIANRTKPAAGAVTVTLPANAAAAKFLRIQCNNATQPRARVSFSIFEITATADFPPPPTTGDPVAVTGNFNFSQLFPGFPQYRPDTGRLRYEAVGARTDPAQIALDNAATDALSETPTHRYRGRGRIVRANTGAVLGTADVFMVQPVDEPGVIVEADPVTGNEVEIIWPAVTEGIPGANAIVRVQLNSAPADLSDTEPLNVTYTIDKVNAANQVVATWTGTTNNVTIAGAGGGQVPAPVPGGITGNFTFQQMFGSVVQYRPNRGRLRFEAVGGINDPATISLTNLAGEALAPTPTHRFRGRGRIFRANGNGTNGALLGQADVFMVQPPDEPGVIVEEDPATGNVVEIIWPSVTEGIPGDAIVRVELSNAPTRLDNTFINAEFTIDKVNAANQVVATWTGRVTRVQVPVGRN
jgi:hypothetical protein